MKFDEVTTAITSFLTSAGHLDSATPATCGSLDVVAFGAIPVERLCRIPVFRKDFLSGKNLSENSVPIGRLLLLRVVFFLTPLGGLETPFLWHSHCRINRQCREMPNTPRCHLSAAQVCGRFSGRVPGGEQRGNTMKRNVNPSREDV